MPSGVWGTHRTGVWHRPQESKGQRPCYQPEASGQRKIELHKELATLPPSENRDAWLFLGKQKWPTRQKAIALHNHFKPSLRAPRGVTWSHSERRTRATSQGESVSCHPDIVIMLQEMQLDNPSGGIFKELMDKALEENQHWTSIKSREASAGL